MRYLYLKDGEIYEFLEDQLNLVDDTYLRITGESYDKLVTQKPSDFHNTWLNGSWVDARSDQEIKEYNRTIMSTLTPIEFDIKLNKNGLYDAVQDLIKTDFELRIAYTRAIFFSRTDPFIDQARIALGLTDEQVDEMWMN